MKYLKKYNEATVYIQNSDIKSLVYEKLRELKLDIDENFHIIINNYIENDDANKLNKSIGREFIKGSIMKETHFTYDQISETIESLKGIMESKGWNLWNYSCYLGQRPPTPKIERELNRQFDRFGDGRWTESRYSFSITFVKGDNKDSPYIWMMDGNKSQLTNEELNPETYKSAADILAKAGHERRPRELMKWYEIGKQKEEEEKKRKEEEIRRKKLEDSAQLGIFTFRLRYGKKEFIGDFYLNLQFADWTFDEDYDYFKDHEGKLYITFNFGIIPATEEALNYCKENVEKITGIGSDKLTYWIGDFRLHASDSTKYFLGDFEEAPHPDGDDPDIGEFTVGEVYRNTSDNKDYEWNGEDWIEYHPKLKPLGTVFFEPFEGYCYLFNRTSAIQFKQSLHKILNGDIYFGESEKFPGGLREHLATELCEKRNHSSAEFIQLTQSILKINNNDLFRH